VNPHIFIGHAIDFADIQFLQAVKGHHLNLMKAAYGVGRLLCTPQGAGVDGIYPFILESLSQGFRLPFTGLIQAVIAQTLHPPLLVPVSRSMSHQYKSHRLPSSR
jgi:hypothetical protein